MPFSEKMKLYRYRDIPLGFPFFAGLGMRLFVFLFQDPFNNDLHFQIIDWIHRQGTLPLATQFSQAYHPPLYYLLAQLFYLGDSSRPSLKVLQLFSLLTSIMTFVVFYQMINRFIHSSRIRFYTTLFVALLPQFIMFGNYVSNDSLSNFLGVLLFMQAYLYIERPVLLKKIWLAVILGLGLLTKGTFLVFIPIVLLLVTVVEWRSQRRIPSVMLSLLIVAALFFAIGSYKYVENYCHFGNPFIHNTDPLIQKSTGWHWARSQKNTYIGVKSILDWNIGKLILRPTLDETTRHSYFLMLYGSFWYQYIPESNLMGNKTGFRYLGSAIYFLALVPTVVLFLGLYAFFARMMAVLGGQKLDEKIIQGLFSLFAFLATLGLVVYIGVRTDVWSCFQARLAFPAFWGIIVLFSSGLEKIERRPRLASVVYFMLNFLFILFVLYFVCELLIILRLV